MEEKKFDATNYVKEIEYKSPWGGETMTLRCEYNYYLYGGIALELMYFDEELQDWEPYMTATSCIDGLADDELAIKNYSENEGIYFVLMEQGVIRPAHREGFSGFCRFPICHLKPIDDYKVEYTEICGLSETDASMVWEHMQMLSNMRAALGEIGDEPWFVELSNDEKHKIISDIATHMEHLLEMGDTSYNEALDKAVSETLEQLDEEDAE